MILWGMATSIQAPFYPIEATSKGATVSMFGPVFGIYYGTNVFVSFFVERCIDKVGLSKTLQLTIFVSSTTPILFGCLTFIWNLPTFLVLSYTLRIIEGVSSAILYVAVQTLLLFQYPDKTSAVYSLVEGTNNLGIMLGPVVGTFLYNVGGFILPFVSCGSGMLILGAVALWAVKKWLQNFQTVEDPEENFDSSILNLLCSNGIFPSK